MAELSIQTLRSIMVHDILIHKKYLDEYIGKLRSAEDIFNTLKYNIELEESMSKPKFDRVLAFNMKGKRQTKFQYPT